MFDFKSQVCLHLEDWYNGETHSVSLENAIAYKETIEMNKIQLQDCRIMLSWLIIYFFE